MYFCIHIVHFYVFLSSSVSFFFSFLCCMKRMKLVQQYEIMWRCHAAHTFWIIFINAFLFVCRTNGVALLSLCCFSSCTLFISRLQVFFPFDEDWHRKCARFCGVKCACVCVCLCVGVHYCLSVSSSNNMLSMCIMMRLIHCTFPQQTNCVDWLCITVQHQLWCVNHYAVNECGISVSFCYFRSITNEHKFVGAITSTSTGNLWTHETRHKMLIASTFCCFFFCSLSCVPTVNSHWMLNANKNW